MTKELQAVFILRLPAVERCIGLKKSTIYKLVQDGKFPKPIQLTGSRSVGWISTSIDHWIAERAGASK